MFPVKNGPRNGYAFLLTPKHVLKTMVKKRKKSLDTAWSTLAYFALFVFYDLDVSKKKSTYAFPMS